MRRRLLAAALCLSIATTAFAQDSAVRVELPEGPEAGANRPFRIRVLGGADRVRAPGTPWALPIGERGDEFVLQMPAALSFPLDVTVERGGTTERVVVPATPIPSNAPDSADRAFDPLRLGPDPELFAALEEVAAGSPRLDPGESTLLLVLAAAEVGLALVLAFRRDRPWIRAAWLSIPAAAACFAIGGSASTSPLVAVPFVAQAETGVVYVRVHALRDGAGSFELPNGATVPAALIRFSADDRSIEDAEAGAEVRLKLRAGETRVFGYVCSWRKPVTFDLVGLGPPAAEPGPAVLRWLAEHGMVPEIARAGTSTRSRPLSRDARVLPGLAIQGTKSPTK